MAAAPAPAAAAADPPAQWPDSLKPPAETAPAAAWQTWFDKARPIIGPLLPPLIALKLPALGSKPSRASLIKEIKKDDSHLRVGLALAAVAAAKPAPASPPSAPGSSTGHGSASTGGSPPHSGTSSSSSPGGALVTVPGRHGSRPDCATPRCENVASSLQCDFCQTCCKRDECPAALHITHKLRREREKNERIRQTAAVESPPAASGATLSPETMASLITHLAATRNPSTTTPSVTVPSNPVASGAGATQPAPPGTVSQGPLPSTAHPSITWFQVVSAWKLYSFAADDSDRVASAFDHISAAFTQRLTLLFHNYFTALGSHDITRRFEPKPPPPGKAQADWDAERSDRILAASSSIDHLMAILRAFARSRFVVPKKKCAIWFLIQTSKESSEFYAIRKSQENVPKLDPANPLVNSSEWAGPHRALWWMLFACSLPLGIFRTSLETAVEHYGESVRASNSSMFVAEPVYNAKYSAEAVRRREARGTVATDRTTQRRGDAVKVRRTTNNHNGTTTHDRQTTRNDGGNRVPPTSTTPPTAIKGGPPSAGRNTQNPKGGAPTATADKKHDLGPLPRFSDGRVDWKSARAQKKAAKSSGAGTADAGDDE